MSIGVPGAVISAGTSISPTRPADLVPPLGPTLANTGPNGYTLVNGTPQIFAIQAPNDGKQHCFQVNGILVVTVLEVGGQLTIGWTLAGIARSVVISAGNLGANPAAGTGLGGVCDSGSVVTATQTTALTSGAAIWYSGAFILW